MANPKTDPPEPKIALALSGGGARAIAFHLGCLRALEKTGVLDRIAVISSVSGGSVLAALYCSHQGTFNDFEKKTKQVLSDGLVWPTIRIVLTTTEGIKAIVFAIPFIADRLAAFIVRQILKLTRLEAHAQISWLRSPRFRRRASRTTILKKAFDEVFSGKKLTELRLDRPKLIIIACELQSKSAFYFASETVGSWRYGVADPTNIDLSYAVTASASYPAALPALDGIMNFKKNGKFTSHRIILTDGGVYDNLGLAPLWPGRTPEISLHVDQYQRIIACRAGYGIQISDPTGLWPSRMLSVVSSIHARAQNFAMTRLFDLKQAGALEGFLLPYLDQDDSKLKYPPSDLVLRESVAKYPTDFYGMSDQWINNLSLRGEQLTHALLREHWPELLKA